MVAGLKCLRKIMQFQRNFHFKGLNLPHKMITQNQCKCKTPLLILDSIVTLLLIHLLLILTWV